MNFEDLVKGTSSPKPPVSSSVGGMPWDEGWADSNGGADSLVIFLTIYSMTKLIKQSNAFASSSITPSPYASPKIGSQPTSSGSKLKARPVPASTFNSSMFNASSPSSSSTNSPNIYSTPTFSPIQPQITSFTPLQPTSYTPPQVQQSTFPQSTATGTGSGMGPNYNISLAPSAPSPRPPQNASMSFVPPPQAAPLSQAPIQARPQQQATLAPSKPPPGYSSGLMQPTVVAKPSIPTVNGKVDWGDFDPLK